MLRLRAARVPRVRWSSTKSPLSVAFSSSDEDEAAERYRNQKNPVIPSVTNLEARWRKLDAAKQDDVIAFLEDKMRGDWREMSPDEKRAAYYVWYGNWGPRASAKDFSSLYNYLAGVVGITMAALIAFKLITYSSETPVPGLDYLDEERKE